MGTDRSVVRGKDRHQAWGAREELIWNFTGLKRGWQKERLIQYTKGRAQRGQ
jgi:hypothetical protein